ncbi:hypothetical protein BVIET440_150128 [Burkholderia vietnamiensis]
MPHRPTDRLVVPFVSTCAIAVQYTGHAPCAMSRAARDTRVTPHAIALGQYFEGVFLSDHAQATTETSRWDGPRYLRAGTKRSARCTASSRNTSGS